MKPSRTRTTSSDNHPTTKVSSNSRRRIASAPSVLPMTPLIVYAQPVHAQLGEPAVAPSSPHDASTYSSSPVSPWQWPTQPMTPVPQSFEEFKAYFDNKLQAHSNKTVQMLWEQKKEIQTQTETIGIMMNVSATRRIDRELLSVRELKSRQSLKMWKEEQRAERKAFEKRIDRKLTVMAETLDKIMWKINSKPDSSP